MNAISQLFDTTSKRWLAVLAAAVLLSGAAMVRSLLNAMAPSEEPTVTVELPARVVKPTMVTRTEPSWNGASSGDASVDGQTVPPVRTSPFAAEELVRQENHEILQKQAEYFKKVMVNGRLPQSLGGLTQQQVDDMQQKGLMIE